MRFVWLSILAVAGSVRAACNTIQRNTDFQGNDLDAVAANSAAECCAPCQSNPLCTGFSFLDGVCYLKYGQLTRITKAGVSTGTVQASQCLPWEENVDYYGDDLVKDTSITTPGECCDLCAANPACKLYVVSIYGCMLKSAGTDRRPDQDPSWNVKAAFVRPTQTSQCGVVTKDVDYPGNDIQRFPSVTDAEQCCSLCAQNADCKLYVVSIYGCSLKSAAGTPSPVQNTAWNVKAAFKTTTQTQCGTVTKDFDYPGNDIQRYTNVTEADQCCALCSQNANCKLYVSSIFGCSLKSAAGTPSPIPNTAWNVRAAFLNVSYGAVTTPTTPLVDATYSPDIRVAPVAFTTVAGAQWLVSSQLESTEDDLEALVKALNLSLASHKHGVKPEMLITAASDGSMVLPFMSVNSTGECAALVKSHGQTFFTYLPTSATCLGHQFASTNASYAMKVNGSAVQLAATAADDFIIKVASATNSNDCLAQCEASSACVVARFTDKCYLYAPAPSRSSSVVAGWVSSSFSTETVANLPTFANATKVAFYVVAHEDDHELFMSNNYHVSISDPKTKVVFVYTTAGDDSSGDAWRQARELGTLAATKAWVDHAGKLNSTPVGDAVAVNNHTIARVTIGNCVHYFMRMSEYGTDGSNGFMALINNERPVAPMDDPTNHYKNRAEFKATLAAILTKEADGISTIDMNAQDPLGEQPDHDMHLATGALVSEIVSENAKSKICVPQKYFYDYQTWFDDVNVAPEVEKLQRYAWMRMSQAIHAFDATILFWSEHAINLGRTYIRRTIHGNATAC